MRAYRYMMDIENLVDFFEIKFRHPESKTIIAGFAMYPGSPPLDRERLVELLKQVTIFTFNGNNYDLPILVLALYGATHEMLKAAGDKIITQGLKPWDFYTQYGLEVPDFIDHVDLYEVAPGVRIGLKAYMGRMHAPTIQDLPTDPMAHVPAEQREEISVYCDNDLFGTEMLADALRERVELRERLSQQYEVDLRSKSDAQIAEAVIKAKLGFRPDRRYVQHGYTFRYEPPAYIGYVTAPLRELLDVVRSSDFVVTDREEALEYYGLEDVRTGVQIPASLKGRDIRIGSGLYRIGIGGLHSQESSQHFIATPGVHSIRDVDVKSYYPSLILGMGMYPQQLGPGFLDIYRGIYRERLHSKSEAERLEKLGLHADAAEHKTIADGFKIVLNGTFGKLFSKYSIFYAPEFGIATTITGQLSLLMLIEMMELSGIRVISANTDGIVLLIPHGYDAMADQVVAWWEQRTGMEMEASHYAAIYSRDVNNYLAITTSGKVKRNGIFRPSGLLSGPQGKHPDEDICADAVVAFLKDRTPLDVTIRTCRDIRKFVTVRNVKGGGVYHRSHFLEQRFPDTRPEYLGKVVRWYKSHARGSSIRYASNGNKVADSDSVTPAMTLPTEFPADVDYEHYIAVSKQMLKAVGL
jgi:DNA polymerase elongation subunit (family B)